MLAMWYACEISKCESHGEEVLELDNLSRGGVGVDEGTK